MGCKAAGTGLAVALRRQSVWYSLPAAVPFPHRYKLFCPAQPVMSGNGNWQLPLPANAAAVTPDLSLALRQPSPRQQRTKSDSHMPAHRPAASAFERIHAPLPDAYAPPPLSFDFSLHLKLLQGRFRFLLSRLQLRRALLLHLLPQLLPKRQQF